MTLILTVTLVTWALSVTIDFHCLPSARAQRRRFQSTEGPLVLLDLHPHVHLAQHGYGPFSRTQHL